MRARQVETAKDFLAFGDHLLGLLLHDKTIEPSLKIETFLRSLWKAMLVLTGKELTWRLCAEMFEAATILPPLDFDEAWRSYTEWPDFDKEGDEFELAKAMILFQIADLHRVQEILDTRDKVLIKEIGVYLDKEWENAPDAFSFLSAGFRYIEDVRMPPDAECSWFFIPWFLRAGQQYE